MREFAERFELIARIDGTEVFAGLGDFAHLLNAENTRAIFGGRHKSGQTASAQAYNNDFIIERFSDFGLVDLGSLTKPARSRRTLGGGVFDGLVAFVAVSATRK